MSLLGSLFFKLGTPFWCSKFFFSHPQDTQLWRPRECLGRGEMWEVGWRQSQHWGPGLRVLHTAPNPEGPSRVPELPRVCSCVSWERESGPGRSKDVPEITWLLTTKVMGKGYWFPCYIFMLGVVNHKRLSSLPGRVWDLGTGVTWFHILVLSPVNFHFLVPPCIVVPDPWSGCMYVSVCGVCVYAVCVCV